MEIRIVENVEITVIHRRGSRFTPLMERTYEKLIEFMDAPEKSGFSVGVAVFLRYGSHLSLTFPNQNVKLTQVDWNRIIFQPKRPSKWQAFFLNNCELIREAKLWIGAGKCEKEIENGTSLFSINSAFCLIPESFLEWCRFEINKNTLIEFKCHRGVCKWHWINVFVTQIIIWNLLILI